jgi:uncharacterized protein
VSEADSIDWLPLLLVVQGLLGALDTLLNRRGARRELALHAAREAVYAALFLGFAWLAWLGAFAVVIAVLLAAVLAITLAGELVQNRIQVLLMLNLGAIIALAVPALLDWGANPTELAPAHHGWMSWALTVFGLASAAWSVRDAVAALDFSRRQT